MHSENMGLPFIPWVKVQNFQNPELEKFKFYNLQNAWKIVTISSLNGQMASNTLKTIKGSN